MKYVTLPTETLLAYVLLGRPESTGIEWSALELRKIVSKVADAVEGCLICDLSNMALEDAAGKHADVMGYRAGHVAAIPAKKIVDFSYFDRGVPPVVIERLRELCL